MFAPPTAIYTHGPGLTQHLKKKWLELSLFEHLFQQIIYIILIM